MMNHSCPKINLYTKKQLANAISGGGLSFDGAMALIDDCITNKDEYWFDNLGESNPDEDKWVRSAFGTPLGELHRRINQQVLTIYDKDLPPFVYGGVGKRGIKNTVNALRGSKNKRTLLKIDMRRFFEHVSYDDIVETLVHNCSCGDKVATVIAEAACIRKGEKSPSNNNEKVLARGFSTSSRLAIWCNLDVFWRIFILMSKRLKGHDPRIAIYMDDIGITASRVDPVVMSLLHKDILRFIKDDTGLEINEDKTKLIDYIQREYDVSNGLLKEGATAQFEFLGVGMGRNCLYPGAKIRGKMAKMRNKPSLSKGELRTLKGQKRYVEYIVRRND